MLEREGSTGGKGAVPRAIARQSCYNNPLRTDLNQLNHVLIRTDGTRTYVSIWQYYSVPAPARSEFCPHSCPSP